MKKFTLSIACLGLCFFMIAQTYQLTLIDGYGGGLYEAGDTVHIWSKEFSPAGYFVNWSGDAMYAEDAEELHTRVIMPAANITLTANFKALGIPAYFGNEQIQGADTLKHVYYYFPQPTEIKGLVYLFHGTNGSAAGWISNFERFYLVKRLFAEGYGIIITECEEATRDRDFNGDGVYRWDYSIDTLTNIDILNLKAITDTLQMRGYFPAGLPKMGLGTSAGGTFAIHIGTIFRWKGAISHHASGPAWVAPITMTPIQYSMNRNDNHPDVGPVGNAEAFDYYNTLLDRGICSEYHMFLPQPLFPERFARVTTSDSVGKAKSIAIFNELSANGELNADNYLRHSGNYIKNLVLANPANWPVLASLSVAQRAEVENQLEICYSSHVYHNDFLARDLHFLDRLCATVNTEEQPEFPVLSVYPNPTQSSITIEGDWMGARYDFIGLAGNVAGSGVLSANTVSIRDLSPGLYFLRLQKGKTVAIEKVVVE